ncbi:MAG: sigma-E factor negative regulatory protein [Steroidobacteraceae bacterium]|nr:sigma-E factor negative regulatory protein [Steroidobacteraceae bacterium]
MSEQIREQISAFLDGELPRAQTELLLKRLTRDAALREAFGRYAMIGELCRGASGAALSRGLAARVASAIDAEAPLARAGRWRARRQRLWRHAASAGVAAVVAVVAVFALQQRADTPTVMDASGPPAPVLAKLNREALSYTVPTTIPQAPAALPPARLTNYVFAHSEYSSFLGGRSLLSGLIAAPEQTAGPANRSPAAVGVVIPAAAASVAVPARPSNGP